MLPEEKFSLQTADIATIMDILTRNTKNIIVRAKHCYSRKIVTNERCDYCNKSMFLLALRCKDCRFKCHRKCAQSASARCDLNLQGRKTRASSKPRQQARPKNRAVQLAHPGEFLHAHHALSPPPSASQPPTSRTGQPIGEGLPLLQGCRCIRGGGGVDTIDLRRASDCGACRRLQSSPPDSPRYTLGARTRYSTVQMLQDAPSAPHPHPSASTRPGLGCYPADQGYFHLDGMSATPARPPSKTHWARDVVVASTSSDVSSVSYGYFSASNSESGSQGCRTAFTGREEEVEREATTGSSLSAEAGGGSDSSRGLTRAEKQRKWSRAERSKTVDVTGTRKREAEMGKSLISTWPPHGHSPVQADAVPESLDDAHRMCDSLASSKHHGGIDHDIREAVKEWSIPHEDVKYGQCLRAGRNGSTYRGNWHGEVLIHTRCHVEDVDAFLEEVSVLSMIRHENIALFMGACIDPPNLAVVTCVQKGPSLYQHLHIKQSKSPMHSRIHIARQIAQGMGYLHARGIVVGDLNTKAIFLESKVKLCLTGYDTTDGMCEREDYASVPQGHLTYIAPEILRTLRVQPPYVTEAEPHTMESDVYAFGTVLYELLTSKWPYESKFACPDSVIYRVCTGKRESLSGIKCVPSVKCLVEDCWSHVPNLRPTFLEIVEELNQNAALVNMKHSLSEPDCLNRIGRPW